jgi:restriction system protein
MLKLNENSLFAVLLRSHWLISFAIATGVFLLARLFVPPIYAAIVPLPFLAIGCVVLWRQLRKPSANKVAKRMEALRALPREEFASALEQGFRRQGYGVTRLGADLQVTKSGRVSIVDCRRWKATRTGVEPLREAQALAAKRDAQGVIYIVGGELTDKARAFAGANNIRVIGDAELTELVG